MSRKYMLLAGVSTALLAAPVFAQDAAPAEEDAGLEEIVVTAQKREQNLQDVPVSVTALSAETLQNKGIAEFADLTRAAPSLTITESSTSPSSSINLRGIGTFAFSIGVEPSVAVVVDDVALLQQAQAFSNLTDVERIEVLRGPQGTLFGKNASAGAVNIVTKSPSKELTGAINLLATTDEEYKVDGSISGPLGDGAGFRINAFYSDREGYVRNLTTGNRVNGARSYGIRGRLNVSLAENFELALLADYGNTKTNGIARTFRDVPTGATILGGAITPNLVGVIPGKSNDRVRFNVDPTNTNKQALFSARATLDLGVVNLISVTSYQDWKYNFLEDVDGTETPAFGIPTGVVQSGPFHAKQFAQELRIVSTGNGPLTYLAGLFYSDGKTDRSFARGPSGPFLAGWAATAGTKSAAAFGQVTYDITETTHIDGGLRYNNEKIDVAFVNRVIPAAAPANNATCLATCFGKDSESQLTGKISLRQDIGSGSMVYASYSTGYKGQGFDISTGFTPGRAANPVKSEHSKAYELGIKSRFLDNRVQLNIAGFLTDYDDFQAQSVVVLPSGALQFGLNNVGKLRTKGVEVEFSAKPTQALRIDASAAYTDAKIRAFPTANCYAGQSVALGCIDPDGAGPLGSVQNLAGKRLANSPKFKFNIGATYDVPLNDALNGFVTLDYQHQSGVSFDLFQNPLFVERGYGILNGSVGIKQGDEGHYRVSLFVNNLFDKQYASNVGGPAGGSLGLTSQVLPRNSQRYFGFKFRYGY
jgi:iron complex outermembrane recepter protein